jgi:glycosyltransferase involved in cell wall biosynthesis
MQKQLQQPANALTLLFVSHYNYYRNFETLIRALPILRTRLPEKPIRLLLTSNLSPGRNPGQYKAETLAALADKLGVRQNIVELGTVPYSQLHHLYSAGQIYVSPAYAETFAHPLVEAMSSGLPVVASDLPVHREICGDAAVYFPRFSPEALADSVLKIHNDRELAETLSRNGLRRSLDFSWSSHVDRLIALAKKMLPPESERN